MPPAPASVTSIIGPPIVEAHPEFSNEYRARMEDRFGSQLTVLCAGVRQRGAESRRGGRLARVAGKALLARKGVLGNLSTCGRPYRIPATSAGSTATSVV